MKGLKIYYYYDNFHSEEEMIKTLGKPDFESDSGSLYWYKKEGTLRFSDHWYTGKTPCVPSNTLKQTFGMLDYPIGICYN